MGCAASTQSSIMSLPSQRITQRSSQASHGSVTLSETASVPVPTREALGAAPTEAQLPTVFAPNTVTQSFANSTPAASTHTKPGPSRLNRVAFQSEKQADFALSDPSYEQVMSFGHAIGEAEELPVLSMVDAAVQVIQLAINALDAGKLDEAESLYRRVLSSREAAQGPDHQDLSQPLQGLAKVLHLKGKFSEAEALLKRALAIEEKTDWRSSPQSVLRMLHLLHSLARVLTDAGRGEEAEPLLRRAVAVAENDLGERNEALPAPLNSLASVLHATGRVDEAEALHLCALSIGREKLGIGHPEVCASVMSLIDLAADAGRLEATWEDLQNVLETDPAMLSDAESTQRVLKSLEAIASLLERKNMLAAASTVFRNTVAIHDSHAAVLEQGPRKSMTKAPLLASLARIEKTQGRMSEAEVYYRAALESWGQPPLEVLPQQQRQSRQCQQLPAEEVASVQMRMQTLDSLAAVLYAQGRLQDVEPIYHAALQAEIQISGPNDLEVARRLDSLADLLKALRRVEEARPYYRQSVLIKEQNLGSKTVCCWRRF